MTELTDKQSRLTALKVARDSGVLSVRHGEEVITWRTMEEIQKIITALEREISVLGGTTRRVKYIYQSCKGL